MITDADPVGPEGPSADDNRIAGDSVAVAGWTLVSRITGFGRFAAIAAVLGPTFFGNLFQATSVLPNLTFELLTGPLIVAMLVPSMIKLLDLKETRAAERLAGGFLGVLIVVFTAAVIAIIAAGSVVLGLLTMLVPDANVRADQLHVGWPLLAMLMPQAILYALAATGVAVQNSFSKFRLAVAAPAVENVGIMIVMGTSAAIYGVGIEVGDVSTGQLLLLGLGSTAAVGLHAALQWWGAWRVGNHVAPTGRLEEPRCSSYDETGHPIERICRTDRRTPHRATGGSRKHPRWRRGVSTRTVLFQSASSPCGAAGDDRSASTPLASLQRKRRGSVPRHISQRHQSDPVGSRYQPACSSLRWPSLSLEPSPMGKWRRHWESHWLR